MDYQLLAEMRCNIAKTPEIWQFNLLSPGMLSGFAKERDIDISQEAIGNLWLAGLLRADVITSTNKLEIPSLELISASDEYYVYSDARQVPNREQGYGGAFQELAPLPKDVSLFFHPFRLYVLYHVVRVFSANANSIQYLLTPKGLNTIADWHITRLDQQTSGNAFAECFEKWNRTAELAIVLEPSAYAKVYHEIRWQFPDTEDTIKVRIQQARENANHFLSVVSAKTINEIRGEICRYAEFLDNNKIIHVLLRLLASPKRKNLRGNIGCCMHFLSMAEIIRCAFEDMSGQELPEEDELGFGQWHLGARKKLYGSERVLDASKRTLNQFMLHMGLESRIKVRCYVEGETEVGALKYVFGDSAKIEVINLHGQVIENKRKGLSFLDSLKRDKANHIFSVVVIDADRADSVKQLKIAATNGSMYGLFFVLEPDFERANFTSQELTDIALQLQPQTQGAEPLKAPLNLSSSKTGKEFFDALPSAGITSVSKGISWGQALAEYAMKNREFSTGQLKEGSLRPFSVIVQHLFDLCRVSYTDTYEEYELDPILGMLQKKPNNG